MRELDEALMDRNTASQNRKHKIINVQSNSRFQEQTCNNNANQNCPVENEFFNFKAYNSVK